MTYENEKRTHRTATFLLAGLLLTGSLVGCAENATSSDTTDKMPPESDGTPTEVVTEMPDPVEDALNRIGDVDWGGKDFTVIYANDRATGSGDFAEEVVGFSDSSQSVASAVVNDAVFERNALFEETCHLKFRQVGKNTPDLNNSVQKDVRAKGGEYQIANQILIEAGNLASAGILYNYLDFRNIDYTGPWWDQGTWGFNLLGGVYFMCGAHNLTDDGGTHIMAFNKNLMADLNQESPYIAVENGEWTLEHLKSITQEVGSQDLNHDGKWDDQDRYAIAANHTIGGNFFYGADMMLVRIPEETHRPELALDETGMEKALRVMDLTKAIILHDHDTYHPTVENWHKPIELFCDGRALFFNEVTSHLRTFSQNMEDDYGALPQPKYDKAQKDYHSWTSDCSGTMIVPNTVTDPEQMGKVLEVYSALSFRHVEPAYMETVIKMRTAKDPQSMNILTMMFHNRIYDMTQYYNFDKFGYVFRDTAYEGGDNFSSRYAKSSGAYMKRVDKMLKNMEKHHA